MSFTLKMFEQEKPGALVYEVENITPLEFEDLGSAVGYATGYMRLRLEVIRAHVLSGGSSIPDKVILRADIK
jgi:hypothetical protein